MSTSKLQNEQQALGPFRPSAAALAAMIDSIPRHLEVEAVAINGQTGLVLVETYHEGLIELHRFPLRGGKTEGGE